MNVIQNGETPCEYRLRVQSAEQSYVALKKLRRQKRIQRIASYFTWNRG